MKGSICDESPCGATLKPLGFTILVVFLVGCESKFVQGYKGNPQSLVQVAVVAKPVDEHPWSETVIYGTDEIQSIRTREVALLPGKRKIFLLRTKKQPHGFDLPSLRCLEFFPTCLVALPIAISIGYSISAVVSPSAAECAQVPEEPQCIEFEFQAQKGSNYIVVADGFDDYKLKDQSTGEFVSVGRSLPPQVKTFSERIFVPTTKWINCPPVPETDNPMSKQSTVAVTPAASPSGGAEASLAHAATPEIATSAEKSMTSGEMSLRVALAPIVSHSPVDKTGDCGTDPEVDFRAAVKDVDGVSLVETHPSAEDPQMFVLWKESGIRMQPDVPRVVDSPVFASAHAVLLISSSSSGGWQCIRGEYKLYLIDRESHEVTRAEADSDTLRQQMEQMLLRLRRL